MDIYKTYEKVEEGVGWILIGWLNFKYGEGCSVRKTLCLMV